VRFSFETIIIATGLSGLAVLIALSQWLWRWDMAVYDWHISTWTRPPPGDILIVAIDNQSIAEFGQWPWPRRQLADMVRNLTDGGARVSAIDLDLSVADPADPEGDALLAQAIAENGRIVLPVTVGQLRAGGQAVEILPMPLLMDGAARLGHTDVDVDPDGFARVVPLYAGLGPSRWPSLAVAMLEVAESRNEPAPETATGSESRAETRFFWRRDQKILIPFAGGDAHFVRVSYADIVRETVPLTVFNDKFVLIGTTASGLGDAYLIPAADGGSTKISGVEMTANVLDTLRRDLAISELTDVRGLAVAAALTFLTVLLYIMRSARWIYLVIGALLIITINTSALRMARVWFEPLPPLVAFLTAAPVMMWRKRHRASQQMFEESQKAQVTLQSIADGVITTDLEGNVNYMNTVAERLTGYRSGAARDQPLVSIFRVVDEDEQDVIDPLDRAFMQKSAIEPTRDAILIGRTGRRHFIRMSVASLRGRRGRVVGFVVTFSDATDVRLLTRVLEHQSTYDALTRLPNRILFHDRLSHGIATARREGRLAAIMLINVEQESGRDAWFDQRSRDGILKAIGSRLEAARREVDTAARLSGDQFAVSLESLPDEQAVTALVFRVLSKIDSPVVLGETKIGLKISTGVSIYPQDGGDIETLLGNADRALVKAMAKPENRVMFAGEHMNSRNAAFARMDTSFEDALKQDELTIAYQPVLSIDANEIVGAEALLKWQVDRKDASVTTEFAPMAEHTGAIVSLGSWALETVIGQAAKWQDIGRRTIPVAITISYREFLDPDLVSRVGAALEMSGLQPQNLSIEVSESATIDDVEHAFATMRALKKIGVQLTVHGFGTGYSSVRYLNRFPIDCVKIDPSVVQAAPRAPDAAALVQAIVSMAHELNLRVIAAGIETEDQLALVREAQCDHVQGAVFGDPLPAGEILSWMSPKAVIDTDPSLTNTH
jgi:diguanylate cyclase (GGDEF)-like protein/PAS domain S-box-containing protein